MLRVTVEIVPWGDEERKKTLGVMEIANMGTQYTEIRRGEHEVDPHEITGERFGGLGEYKVRTGQTQEEVSGRPWSSQTVRGHVRDLGFWRLIYRVLMEFGY